MQYNSNSHRQYYPEKRRYSRSRSRSHDKKKHKKHRYSRSNSPSRSHKYKHKKSKKHKSRSYSRSPTRHKSHKKDKKSRKNKSKSKSRSPQKTSIKIPDQKSQPPAPQEPQPPRRRERNPRLLQNLLVDLQKTNTRKDREQLTMAEQHFKQIDKSGRKPVLMTSFLQTKESDPTYKEQYELQKVSEDKFEMIHKPFQCLKPGCLYKFVNENELKQHLNLHDLGKF